jgi:4'-phosphopantetheinyl transferase
MVKDNNINYQQLLKTYRSVSHDPDLSNNKVDIWRAFLDLPTGQILELSQILSEDELVRAERFHFKKHKIRFIACRGFLRKILSCYSDTQPDVLQFSYSSLGKPSLVSSTTQDSVCFNVSHSKNTALFAIAHNCDLGIDIEYIRSISDLDQLVKRFFSSGEYKIIHSLSGNKKKEVFFNMWTMKEAYLKATGEGLSGLEHVEVCFDSEIKTSLMRAGCPLSGCSVHQFKPAPGYTGAMVVKKHCDS